MTSAADLSALQEIDLQRDARRALIADIESRLVETEELLAAREAVLDAEAAIERLRKRQRDFDGQLADLDAKINPLDTKLYSGSVRNPKELTDLQKEVDSLKARRSKLDDEGLALMESVEAATSALSEAQEDLRHTEAYWQAEQETLRHDKARAEAETARLEEERGRWSGSMSPLALSLYESLRPTKQGRAVARVDRGTCGGCHLTLPSHIVQRVRSGGELVQCPSCQRILVGG